MAPAYTPTTPADRADAAAFAGRVARWDPTGLVRMRRDADGATVRLWAGTPFDTLVTRSVGGALEPADVTVHAGNLVAALAVSAQARVDPGPAVDAAWRGQLPPAAGWVVVDQVPAQVLSDVAGRGVTAARDRPGPHGGASTALLDGEALRVSGSGYTVSVPLRVLFALSGMGFAPADQDEGNTVRVSATDAWLRLDAMYGAVVRRRHALLPLLV